MIAIPIAHVEKAITQNKSTLNQFVREQSRVLRAFRATLVDPVEVMYVDSFIKDFRKIFFANPNQLAVYQNTVGKINANLRVAPGPGQKSFKNKLLDVLGYEKLREKILPAFFHDVGIKSCVYCNAILTISIKKGKAVSGRFQADHYHSKADYPCFSVSLYNLYPSCGPCNNAKGEKNTVQLELYSDDKTKNEKSDFYFSLDVASKAKYLATSDSKEIIIEFHEPNPAAGYNKFDQVFGTKAIYETQRDIVAELIEKSKIYKPVYLQFLNDNFPDLVANPDLYFRFLVGNYTDPKDMHKRPLAKFMMDIARDLDIIK